MSSEKKLLKVSIVIPVYNSAAYLRACLQAVVQTIYPREAFEIIVVDNNSTDESSVIINEFDVRYEFENRVGRSYARNRGIKASSFDYIAFVDSDMIVSPFWLSRLTSGLTGNVSAIQGRIFLSGGSKVRRYRKLLTASKFFLTGSYFYRFPYVDSACCIYRKEVLEAVGGFDIRLGRLEDFDLSLRVLLSGGNIKWIRGLVGFNYSNYTDFFGFFKKQFIDGKWHSALRKKYQQFSWNRFFFPSFGPDLYFVFGELFRFFGQFCIWKKNIEYIEIPLRKRSIVYCGKNYDLSPTVYFLQHYKERCLASFSWESRLLLEGDCSVVEEIFLTDRSEVDLDSFIDNHDQIMVKQDYAALVDLLIRYNILIGSTV